MNKQYNDLFLILKQPKYIWNLYFFGGEIEYTYSIIIIFLTNNVILLIFFNK